jgi:hypothetical protein
MKKNISLFILCLSFLGLSAQTNTWTGSSDTDWHSGCNWSLGHVPTCTENVIIPSGTTNKPTITGVASCLTIDIQGVASTLLTINTGALLQVDQCPTANTVNASGKYVFLSSGSYDANTSVATRDANCASDATAAGLAGTYKAWIYNPGTGANNIPSTGGACGYKKPNGTVVASSWADLTDGTLSSAINMLASGGTLTDWVYTGLSWNGTSSGSNCSSWSLWSANGTYGRSDQTGTGWSAWGADVCGSQTTSNIFNCGGGNQHFIGVNALDNCSCWAGTALDACTANIGSVSGPSHDCAGGWNCAAPCTINFSYCWCCLVTGTSTTTNYNNRRHYCFQQ